MEITPPLSVPDSELSFSFARSGGPGGQNVNKVESKAILHWNLGANTSLPEDVRARIRAANGNKINSDGQLVLNGQRYRDQERNKEDCLEKLREIILRALVVPKPRKKTKPSKGSKLRRLADKKQASTRKANRRPPSAE
jgi:ribosome-associated protein